MIRQREPLSQGCESFKDVAYVRRQLLGNVLASVGLGSAMCTNSGSLHDCIRLIRPVLTRNGEIFNHGAVVGSLLEGLIACFAEEINSLKV